MKNEGKQNTICNKLWIFHKAVSFSLRGVWFAGEGAVWIGPSVHGGERAVSRRIRGSAVCSELGLPTAKKAGGSAETQAAARHQSRSGDRENVIAVARGKVSLPRLSLGPEFEPTFLPLKDFYLCSSILFYNKAPLIL